MWLVGVFDAERRLRDHVDAKRHEQTAEFAQLAGIARSDNETGDHVSSAAFCAAINVRMPRSPSATSVSN